MASREVNIFFDAVPSRPLMKAEVISCIFANISYTGLVRPIANMLACAGLPTWSHFCRDFDSIEEFSEFAVKERVPNKIMFLALCGYFEPKIAFYYASSYYDTKEWLPAYILEKFSDQQVEVLHGAEQDATHSRQRIKSHFSDPSLMPAAFFDVAEKRDTKALLSAVAAYAYIAKEDLVGFYLAAVIGPDSTDLQYDPPREFDEAPPTFFDPDCGDRSGWDKLAKLNEKIASHCTATPRLVTHSAWKSHIRLSDLIKASSGKSKDVIDKIAAIHAQEGSHSRATFDQVARDNIELPPRRKITGQQVDNNPCIKEDLERYTERDEPCGEDNECIICFDQKRCVVFLGCSHQVTCVACAIKLCSSDGKTLSCPECREENTRVIVPY